MIRMNTHTRIDMPKYFDVDVSLIEIEPRIWRSFLLDGEATFKDLHEAIQDAFGWERKHLYEFRHFDESNPRVRRPIRRIARCEQAEVLDDDIVPFAEDLQLDSFFARKEDRCLYLYDFGDYWRHLVNLRAVVESNERFRRRLLDGAMACPPEDGGGAIGYQECCAAVNMSDADISKLDAGAREEIEWRIEWLDGWQPETFDFNVVRKRFED